MAQIAVLFPGQGSQQVGMGRELADEFPSAAGCFERANEALAFDLQRLAWEGPAETLTQTENAQPAILVHSYAVWSVLEAELGSHVAYAAGHSLGEFTAYACAGSLSFEDAVRLVRKRGELMAASRQGSMSAIVGLAADAVDAICERVRGRGGEVVAANYNSPKQIVVSGEPEAVERAAELAKETGAKMVRPLAVSGAFHSPLMKDAVEGLKTALDAVAFLDPAFPVISNVTAQPVTNADEARELLVRQLTSPVRWTMSMEELGRLGVTQMVELGPGKVLTGLLKRMEVNAKATAVGAPSEIAKTREAYR